MHNHSICFDGLENILKFAEAEKDRGNTGGINLYSQHIDENAWENFEIGDKTIKLLETYWADEEDLVVNNTLCGFLAFNFRNKSAPN